MRLRRSDAVKRLSKLQVVCGIALVLAISVASFKIYEYRIKLSDKDYAVLLTTADNVFKNVGATSVKSDKYCGYRSQKLGSDRLYCMVKAESYIPYETEQRGVELVKRYEVELNKVGLVKGDFRKLHYSSNDRVDWVTLELSGMFAKETCRYYAHLPMSGKAVKLYMTCAGEPRRVLFPVRDK